MEPRWFWPLAMTTCARCGEPVPVAQAVVISSPTGDTLAHVECPRSAA